MSSGPLVGVARVAFVLAVSLLACLGTAGSVHAHTSLIASDPADGAVLDTAPTTVTLTFDDSLADLEPAVIVTGPDGGTHQSGPAVVDGAVLSSAVAPLTATGSYTVGYRVVSADGHPVEGLLRFEFVGTPSPPAPTVGAVTSATDAVATAAGIATTPPAPTSAPASAPPTASTGAAVSTAATPSAPVTSQAEPAAESTGSWSALAWAMIAAVAVIAAASAFVVRRRLVAGQPADDGPVDRR